VTQLIRRNPEADPREEAVRRQVKGFRESLTQVFARRSPPKATPRPVELDANAVARLFEEVKVMFQQLPDRLEMSMERRLTGLHARASGGPSVGLMPLGHSTVSDLYGQLRSGSPGDRAIGWAALADLVQTVAPDLHPLFAKMRIAWRRGDIPAVLRAKERISQSLPDLAMRVEGLRGDIRTNLRDLIPMLEHYLIVVDSDLGQRKLVVEPAKSGEGIG